MSTSNNDLDNLNKPHSTRRILFFFISYSAGIIQSYLLTKRQGKARVCLILLGYKQQTDTITERWINPIGIITLSPSYYCSVLKVNKMFC